MQSCRSFQPLNSACQGRSLRRRLLRGIFKHYYTFSVLDLFLFTKQYYILTKTFILLQQLQQV